ncbi:PfkB family carbohydrate kinase [Trinickia dinghuensis]|uniref:PfkB family carbohydrate kinase n=1 Tax=Trinickia dinghuensis TaxID=2291023 RepID=UPI001C69C06E|nr:PfkB family carbohydrate kinase [Trinickia dinghuensis]
MKEPAIHVVGGAYEEQCLKPQWHEVFGSAGRATSAIAAFGGPGLVALHCYTNAWTEEILAARCSFEGSTLCSTRVAQFCSFSYYHGLATPRIDAPLMKHAPIVIHAESIVRFGMLEGDAIVHANQAVYDPQSAAAPVVFQANGSTARHLAVVLNDREAAAMTGLTGAGPEELAQAVRTLNGAKTVVIKLGPLGALVLDESGVARIPAYISDSVWKIGSGDIFVAHFSLRWMYEGRSPQESAMLASLATSQFCDSSGFPTPGNYNRLAASPVVPTARFLTSHRPMVYLAGPFFTLAQLWLIEQVRANLLSFGLSVFSPYHDVGHGSADDVVELDLKGIRDCDILFAIGDGLDPGTIYEIGYARARDIPAIVYCENESRENQKMMEGSGCIMCADYVTAIYKTLWAAISV